jgi:hypothetical protein
MKKDLPARVSIRKSGSVALVKLKLKSRKPLKTESTTKSAIAPTIIPKDAINVITFMAVVLDKLKAYLLAM